MQADNSQTAIALPSGIVGLPQTDVIAYNDFIILYCGYDQIYSTQLVSGGIAKLKSGCFLHDNIVGKHYGDRVYESETSRWAAILRPTAELVTLSVPHRTQILYHPDISLALILLNALPGKRIVETGTGSGSFSVALARAIAPTGHLYTFEFHSERYSQAEKSFQIFGISSLVSAHHRDVYTDGFGTDLIDSIDGVFLDLPAPWKALSSADSVLKKGGYLVNFSPCIEQVQTLCLNISEKKYRDIRTFEILCKPWGITISTADMTLKEERGLLGLELH